MFWMGRPEGVSEWKLGLGAARGMVRLTSPAWFVVLWVGSRMELMVARPNRVDRPSVQNGGVWLPVLPETMAPATGCPLASRMRTVLVTIGGSVMWPRSTEWLASKLVVSMESWLLSSSTGVLMIRVD